MPRAGGVAQVTECLPSKPSMRESLSSSPNIPLPHKKKRKRKNPTPNKVVCLTDNGQNINTALHATQIAQREHAIGFFLPLGFLLGYFCLLHSR
jgi:hypothetical protein